MRITRCLGTAAVLLISACQPETQRVKESTLRAEPSSESLSEQSSERQEETRASLRAGLPSHKIVFRQADGTPKFSIQFKPTGGKLIDRKGNVSANFVLKGDRTIQLTSSRNEIMGYVVRTQDTWTIENPKRTKALFTFRREPDGSAALLQGDGAALHELKATSEGYVVASGKSEQYVVSTQKGTVQLQTNDGTTVVATDSAIEPIALASFGFTQLTQAQQAGLAYALTANVL